MDFFCFVGILVCGSVALLASRFTTSATISGRQRGVIIDQGYGKLEIDSRSVKLNGRVIHSGSTKNIVIRNGVVKRRRKSFGSSKHKKITEN